MIRHNFIFKLISLALAFIIWVMVVNVSNPEMTTSVSIELEVRNADVLTASDKTYELDVQSVRVSYSARSNYQRLIKAQHFTAYVDLYDYSITGAVPIYVDVDDSVSGYVSDISVSPLVAHVSTEDIIERTIDTGYELIGEPERERVVEYVTVSDSSVTVRGPESIVSDIALAVIRIDVEGSESSFSGDAELVFIDSKGDELRDTDDLTADISSLSYYAAVYGEQALNILASASGAPAEGYELSGINVSPDIIYVRGESSLISGYSSIEIPADQIDISGAISNRSFSVDIAALIPEGLIAEGDTTVNVRVFISRTAADEISIETPDESESEAPTDEYEVDVSVETEAPTEPAVIGPPPSDTPPQPPESIEEPALESTEPAPEETAEPTIESIEEQAPESETETLVLEAGE